MASEKSKLTKNIFVSLLYVSLLLIVVLLILRNHYLFASLTFLVLSFLPFLIRFERNKLTAREIVILAILAAVASISRIPFAAIPSVQPSTFVIIISGIVFGPQSGFVIGAMTALVSNIFLGQGPWTPWQMFSWGMIGLLSGFLKNTWVMRTILGKIIFGSLSGIMYGWVMNIWVVLSILKSISLPEILVIYGSSFLFDLLHAFTNAILLLLFSRPWIKILTRFKKKYGLLQEV